MGKGLRKGPTAVENHSISHPEHLCSGRTWVQALSLQNWVQHLSRSSEVSNCNWLMPLGDLTPFNLL